MNSGLNIFSTISSPFSCNFCFISSGTLGLGFFGGLYAHVFFRDFIIFYQVCPAFICLPKGRGNQGSSLGPESPKNRTGAFQRIRLKHFKGPSLLNDPAELSI